MSAVGLPVHSRSGRRASDLGMLPIELEHYLALLDWTGRQVATNQRGVIPSDVVPLVERIGLRPEYWLDLILSLDLRFGYIMGRTAAMAEAAQRMGKRWIRGMTASRQAYP